MIILQHGMQVNKNTEYVQYIAVMSTYQMRYLDVWQRWSTGALMFLKVLKLK
jgi:hypothetical protein